MTSGSISSCSDEVCRVGNTSNRVALLPPELRTMSWNEAFSSALSAISCGLPVLPANCGSFQLSNVSLGPNSAKAGVSCFQMLSNWASTRSCSAGIFDIHCHESWCTLIIT